MVIYSQNWSAGDGDQFTHTPVYTGTPADGVYPEIWHAEHVRVGIGEGPSGQNVLDWNGTNGDYSEAGVGFQIADADISRGRARMKWWFAPDAMDLAFYLPLFWISYNAGTPDIIFGFYLDTPGDPTTAKVDVADYTGPDPTSATFDATPYVGTWVDVELCWTLGSPGAAVVKFNGTTLLTATPNLSTPLSPTGVEAKYIGLGFDGMVGKVTDLVVSDDACGAAEEEDTEPPTFNNSGHCSCGPADGGPSLGGTPETDPLAEEPPVWTTFCDGGGIPPSADDPTNSEIWTL